MSDPNDNTVEPSDYQSARCVGVGILLLDMGVYMSMNQWRTNPLGDDPDSRHFDSGFGVSAWDGSNSDGSQDPTPWAALDWALFGLAMISITSVAAGLLMVLFRG